MAESLTIDRNNELPEALDYNFLRKEGIQLIERLSGKLWTDYNTHDPGITLLEAMCYALTDLGYRTGYDISDILTPASKSEAADWKEVFYTARQVLPCNPLTLIDYRKLIIDTEGVRNAWIEVSDEYETFMYLQRVPINPLTKQPFDLTYDSRKGEDVLHLRGLYKVFVEYEDDVLKDRREEEVAKLIWDKLQFHRNLCEDFISVTSVEYEAFPVEAVIQVNEGTDIEMINARIYKVIYDFFSPPVNFYSLEQMLERYSPEEIFEGPVLNYGFIDSGELQRSERFKNIHLSDIVNIIMSIEGVMAVKKFVFQSDSQYSFANFTEWINNVKDKQKTPRLDIDRSNIVFERSGDRHRQEKDKIVNRERVSDIFAFLKLDNLKTKLRGSAKDLPVPTGDFMDIANYYPFQKNLPAAYGMMTSFIDEDDRADKRSIEIATTELLAQKGGQHGAEVISLILGYKKDKEKVMRSVDRLLSGSKQDSAAAREIIEQVLNEEPNDKLIKRLNHEIFGETSDSREDLYAYIGDGGGFGNPSAKSLLLQELASVQLKKSIHQVESSGDIERLNALYKVHQVHQLDRKQQLVLQLRGFLMVFEQILADYLSQLAHTRDLFSFSDDVKQTVYPQVLDEIEDMQALFLDFTQYRDFHARMLEDTEQFGARRNEILNHLLARFAESFDKYGYFMEQYAGEAAHDKLIRDKLEFLQDYIQVSSYRAKGYNYADSGDTWDTGNVEGLKKRICRLLGIRSGDVDPKTGKATKKSYNRKKIASNILSIRKTSTEPGVDRFMVTMIDPEEPGTVLMTSKKEDYRFESEAIVILTYILEHGSEIDMYSKEGKGDKWHFLLRRLTPENKYEAVAVSKFFATSAERDDALEKTQRKLQELSEDENFHLLEHILLRPKIQPEGDGSPEDILLLPVEYVPDDVVSKVAKQKDAPYKFKITHNSNPDKNTNSWSLSLLKGNTEFFVVKEEFLFYKHVTRRMEHIRKLASDRSNYFAEPAADGYFVLRIRDGGIVLAESAKKLRQQEEFDPEIAALVNFLSYETDFITSPDNENIPSFYADPYSLQVSFILPSWPRRFRDNTFKHLLEKTIYLETPAHIYPHVYWINHDQMRQFDVAYETWANEIAANGIPAPDVVNSLVNVLTNLRK